MPLDLATLEALGARDQREPCQVAEVLATLKPADARVINEGLRHASTKIRRGALAWLAERGHRVNGSALGHHRHGTCKCGKP